jgi:hypothetical protein
MPPRVNRGELLSGVPAVPEEVTQTLAVDLMAQAGFFEHEVAREMKGLHSWLRR